MSALNIKKPYVSSVLVFLLRGACSFDAAVARGTSESVIFNYPISTSNLVYTSSLCPFSLREY